MLNEKGLIGTDIVMKAMLGVLALGLGVALITPGGSFFDSLSEGLGLVDQQVGSTIEVDDRQTFSDAAKYVYHRASNGGCAEGGPVDEQNQDGGYPGLEDTYLGLKPPCAGMEGSFASGPQNAAGRDTGNDMEGVFSRVDFEISEDVEGGGIILDTDRSESEKVWIENNIVGASRGTFNERTNSECGEGTIKSATAAAATAAAAGAQVGSTGGSVVVPVIGTVGGGVFGAVIGGAAGAIGTAVIDQFTNPSFTGTGSNYIVFFAPENVEDRALWYLNDLSGYFSSSTYCFSRTDAVGNADLGDLDFAKSPINAAYEGQGGRQKILLCSGDKGYIQMNKQEPQKEGEAGEGVKGWAYKYPYIQITEAGECDASIYGESLDLNIDQNPIMVEDQLSVTLDGLFENDERVRFDFHKNNELVHQQTVDVETSSATVELTPGENEMNVGSYTVKPTILRNCDDEGENCDSQNVEVSESFEIQHYKYYDDYVPGEYGLSGNREILIAFENEKDYSGSQPVNIKHFDYKSSLDYGYASLDKGPDNRCKLTMADQDAVNNDHGAVFLAQGDIIEKEGSLPSREGIPQDKTGGGPGDDSVWSVYDNFELDGSQWQRSSGFLGTESSQRTLLVESNEGNRLEMVGDLMCAKTSEESERPSLILCDESNMKEGASFGQDYNFDVNGRNYICEPNKGEWYRSEDDVPDVISGVLTTEITQKITEENSNAVDEGESSFIFNPEESSTDDYLIWERLPEGDKVVEITVNFEEKGHLRFEAHRDAGGDYQVNNIESYAFADVFGGSLISLATTTDSSNAGYEYSTGEDYTVRIERSDTQIRWEILQDDSVQWSNTEERADFQRFVLSSWEQFQGEKAVSPKVTIKKVEIEDR